MGINDFGAWLGSLMGRDISNILDNDMPVKGIAIELNQYMHNIAAQVYAYDKDISEELYNIAASKTSKELFNEFCRAFGEHLLTIVRLLRPYQYLMLITDGVANSGKMSQQRPRRIKSARDEYKSSGEDV